MYKVIDELDFSKSPDGLIPVVTQDCDSLEVLMVAFVNKEALAVALECGEAVYFSRSRQKLWHKGDTSGNVQILKEVLVDCDQDSIVYKVKQLGGGACHTGNRSCFFRRIKDGVLEAVK